MCKLQNFQAKGKSSMSFLNKLNCNKHIFKQTIFEQIIFKQTIFE